jgi:hypothetical protein
MFRPRRHGTSLIGVVALVAMASTAHAQGSRPAGRQESGGLGVDVFGGAVASWPSAKESFKAVGLPSNEIDFGGGARLTGLWSGVFVQVSGARWSDTGERVFIDSDGTRFPLGIPLAVKARFMDGTLGVQAPLSAGRDPYVFFLGGGVGFVRYSESSPFADAGEDLEVTKVSYHALAAVEIPIVRHLAAVVETKYRYVPNLLGDGGASAIFGEDSFGGFNATVGLRIGFGGRPATRTTGAARSEETTPPRVNAAPNVQAPRTGSPDGITLAAAPVYLRPDASRVPLKTLETGTPIRVLQQQGDWLQIEFPDRQWGPRIGWIQRRFVQLTPR